MFKESVCVCVCMCACTRGFAAMYVFEGRRVLPGPSKGEKQHESVFYMKH